MPALAAVRTHLMELEHEGPRNIEEEETQIARLTAGKLLSCGNKGQPQTSPSFVFTLSLVRWSHRMDRLVLLLEL